MGLDLYAGTLTRYYNRNWKTVTQQWAEANGMGFTTIHSEVSPDNALSVEEIERGVSAWRDAVLQAISPKEGSVYSPWIENSDASYYTEKPDWIAFGALLLYGACKKYELEVPLTVKKDWQYADDEIIKRAYDDEQLNWTLFTGVEWWIPIELKFSFACESPNGSEIMIGTTGSLLAELNRINEFEWQASHEIITDWQNTEGYPADATLFNGEYKRISENQEYDTLSLAKFAFSIFYQAAHFSLANRVPILMDY